eukprot:532910-Pelagomonas_calceolata.AAC.4
MSSVLPLQEYLQQETKGKSASRVHFERCLFTSVSSCQVFSPLENAFKKEVKGQSASKVTLVSLNHLMQVFAPRTCFKKVCVVNAIMPGLLGGEQVTGMKSREMLCRCSAPFSSSIPCFRQLVMEESEGCVGVALSRSEGV